jgi:hypothetical protein
MEKEYKEEIINLLLKKYKVPQIENIKANCLKTMVNLEVYKRQKTTENLIDIQETLAKLKVAITVFERQLEVSDLNSIPNFEVNEYERLKDLATKNLSSFIYPEIDNVWTLKVK